MIPEDSVFLSLDVKASTIVLSLSITRTSLRTVMEKLETTVNSFTSNERNTKSSGIIESATESVFIKNSDQFDSSGRVNFANSVPVESPDLVSFRDPLVRHII